MGAGESDLVVVDFHGGPGCRLAISADPLVLVENHVRWITVDRPGLGLSDPHTRLGLEARRNPKLAVELFSAGLSRPELAILQRPEVEAEFVDTIVEATRQGAIGLVDDLRVEMQPWGFDPRSIRCPGFVWQGDDDSFSTPDMARQWAASVPDLQLTILPGEGHFFPFARTAEIVTALRNS